MPIDDTSATQALACSTFYLDPFRILLLAMVQAEGGREAFIRAIQCSRPDVREFPLACAIACKTIRRRVDGYQHIGPVLEMAETDGQDPWTKEDNPHVLIPTDGFIDYLGARWAPVGVSNDPHDLNHNWAANVKALCRTLAHVKEVSANA